MTIPIASIKNKIISTQKIKMIKFQNTTAPGQYISYDGVFFYSTAWCVHLVVF